MITSNSNLAGWGRFIAVALALVFVAAPSAQAQSAAEIQAALNAAHAKYLSL